MHHETSMASTLTLNDFMLYGSGRLGSYQVNEPAGGTAPVPLLAANLRFELTDHLGTVRAVVTGQKTGTGNAEIVSLTDYYPYGMDMPGRSFQSEAYRYGYQGSERDPEMSGGAGYTTYFRALDPRIGRWLTPDPKVFPWQSPYVSMDGNPIALIDPWGASTEDPPAGASSNPLGAGNEITVVGNAPQIPGPSSSAFEPSTVNVGTLAPISVSSPTPTNIAFNPENFALDLSMFSRPEILPMPEIQDRNFYDGNKVAQFTLANDQKFIRGNYPKYKVRPVSDEPIENTTYFDCTGWISYVLAKNYPELKDAIASDNDWGIGPTSEVIDYAKEHGGIRLTAPKVGDIAIWDGHVEIVVKVDGESFSTHGSSGKDGVKPVPHTIWKNFKNSSDAKLKQMGNGGSTGTGKFLGFWTPILPKN